MTRTLTGLLAIIAWITTLVLLVPYQGISLVSVLLYTRLPLSVLAKPEIQFVYFKSYWLSLLSMVIASVAVVVLAKRREQALRIVIIADLATLAVSVWLMLTFR